MNFLCPVCSHAIQCPDHYAGKNATCPKCRSKILIPLPPPATVPPPTPPPVPSAQPAPSPSGDPAGFVVPQIESRYFFLRKTDFIGFFLFEKMITP